jgi:hypothetical protein
MCIPYVNNISYYFLCSDHGGSESVFGDKFADETSWNFDDQDTDSVWGSTALNTVSYAVSFLFLGIWVHISPLPVSDKLALIQETDHHTGAHNSLFGSEAGSPSGASVFGKKRSSFFDDSVPSSPAYTSGFSPKFGESRDDSSSYNFGRFDSFRSQDTGFFPQESRFSRFDSISSSKGETVSGFDTGDSSRNFGRFDSFDDADPFGSSGPFKASGSRSPPKF